MKVKLKNFNLRTIANSGQCFRINEIDEGIFDVVASDKYLRIIKLDNNLYDFKCSRKLYNDFYIKYFDLDNDYNKYKKICLKNDKFLIKCIEYTDGLKILNQDKFETIISFIISQRKSVKAIMTSIERLCKLCGKKISTQYGVFYSFPKAKNIIRLGRTKLSACGLGYRLDYILDFCKDFAAGKYDLESFDKLTDEELLEKLMEIKGIGIKVASCIALFAYHRVSICPKDVWINRVLDKYYGGNVPDKYNKYAGIIQQYWFNYTRINGIEKH